MAKEEGSPAHYSKQDGERTNQEETLESEGQSSILVCENSDLMHATMSVVLVMSYLFSLYMHPKTWKMVLNATTWTEDLERFF